MHASWTHSNTIIFMVVGLLDITTHLYMKYLCIEWKTEGKGYYLIMMGGMCN